jgi:hypothetical protein
VPVTNWRRPALAPVYALLTAFVVVVVVGLATGASASAATLRVDAGTGVDVKELAGSTVEVREPSGEPVAVGDLSTQGTFALPDSARGRRLCLRLPAQWRITDPAITNQCTVQPLADRLDAEFPVTATRDAWVVVRFQTDQATPAPAGVTVSLRDQLRQSPVESGPLDASSRYQPRSSLEGKTVCVLPPVGWTLKEASTADGERTRCVKVTDVHNDTTLTLVKGGEG